MVVAIRAVSSWQKPDCLFCSADAALEAVSADIVWPLVVIRCCNSDHCKELAKAMVYSTIASKRFSVDKPVQTLDAILTENVELQRQNAELRNQIVVLTAQNRDRDRA